MLRPLPLCRGLPFVSLLLAACGEAPSELATRGSASPASVDILDGARGGTPGFYFLPPLVPGPTYAGVFDRTRSPEVRICALVGSACGSTSATFSGSAVKVEPTAEYYQANWKTRDAGLSPTAIYRIQVLLGTLVQGYADVVILENGRLIRTVDKGQVVSTFRTATALPIRFRIETAPPPPPPSNPWSNGDLFTADQGVWGGGQVMDVLRANFDAVYAGTGGVLEVGVLGAAGYSMAFQSSSAVEYYLPATGPIGVLTADAVDPSASPSGSFGGEVVALALNVDFDDAGVGGASLAADGLSLQYVLFGRAPIRLGDLTLCNMSPPGLNGITVRQFLGIVNDVLGDFPTPYTLGELAVLVPDINSAFADGVASAFARQHLGYSGCQPVQWANGSRVTLTQDRWGARALTDIISASFDHVYAATGGVLEVGLQGASGYSIALSSASAVLHYLPAIGAIGSLMADVVDPTSTASGAFGGEVTALTLNVDFTDAGNILGRSGLRLGDLTLCGFTTPAGLNGRRVRDVLTLAHSALGSGSAPYTITELHQLLVEINNSFDGGIATPFAQGHLVSGACT